MGCTPVNIFLPQVTRIPIAGPAPFNTLVCCCAIGTAPIPGAGIGYVARAEVTLGTDFVLAGFDQRVPPVFQHSTAAWLTGIGPGEDDTWLYAVDKVADSGFDPVTGQYFINLDVGVMYPHIPSQFQGGIQFNAYYISVCSYVLVHEPPTAGSPLPFPVRSAVRKQDNGGNLVGRAVNRGAVVPFVVPSNAPPIFQATMVTGSAPSAQLNSCPRQCDCCREGGCAHLYDCNYWRFKLLHLRTVGIFG